MLAGSLDTPGLRPGPWQAAQWLQFSPWLLSSAGPGSTGPCTAIWNLLLDTQLGCRFSMSPKCTQGAPRAGEALFLFLFGRPFLGKISTELANREAGGSPAWWAPARP